MNDLEQRLTKLNACTEAVEWAAAYPDLQSAWDACEHADWMCWLLVNEHRNDPRVRLVLCACARTALPYTTDVRARECIEVAERYAYGNATDAELAAARDAARDAAGAAAGDAAWDAARAAAGDAALKRMAVIVRRMIPNPDSLPELNAMMQPEDAIAV